MPGFGSGQHAGQERPHHSMHRFDIEIEGEIPVILGTVQYRSMMHITGDITDDIHLPDRIRIFGHGLTVGDIEGTRICETIHIKLGRINVCCPNLRSLGHKTRCNRRANSLACRGDDNLLAVQSVSHDHPPNHLRYLALTPRLAIVKLMAFR